MVFETDRLIIRKAVPCDEDTDLFFRLWTNPEVMKFVGFPEGLAVSREEIRKNIDREDNSEFSGKLVVELRDNGALIGECKLGLPDSNGISMTDVKLLPVFWGMGFGSEIKRGLVFYLFSRTDCLVVEATPNKCNIASQKMQEAVGGRIVGEGIYRFPPGRMERTIDVPYFVYQVTRDDWVKRNSGCPNNSNMGNE